jgi:type IV fimbrial biogenesis protein FimT
MLTLRAARGITLIELMATLAIVGILTLLGLPYYGKMIENTQARNAAESIQNGLRAARAEAVRRNAPVRLHLTSPAGLADWITCLPDPADPGAVCAPSTASALRWWSANDGAPNARIGVAGSSAPNVETPLTTPPPGAVAFDGLGRALVGSAFRIDITSVNTQGNAVGQRLVIQISPSGQVRMCDPSPALALDDARRCL